MPFGINCYFLPWWLKVWEPARKWRHFREELPKWNWRHAFDIICRWLPHFTSSRKRSAIFIIYSKWRWHPGPIPLGMWVWAGLYFLPRHLIIHFVLVILIYVLLCEHYILTPVWNKEGREIPVRSLGIMHEYYESAQRYGGGDGTQERGPRMSASGVMQIRGHGWLHTPLHWRSWVAAHTTGVLIPYLSVALPHINAL